MHPAIPHLIELDRVDHNIAGLQAELQTYPKRVQDADARLTAAKSAVIAAKEALTNALKERKKFELDVDQWKDRARKYRDQSGAVKSNEAYKALLHEIANAEAEVAKAEDRQLDVMMNGEEFERRVRRAEADLKETDTSVSAERNSILALHGEKQKQLAAANAERQKLIAPVPENVRDLYTRIAKRHNGIAIARVRDGQCSGCGVRILPHIDQELHQEANEELYRCEMCGKLLYTLDPIPAANSGSSASKTSSADSESSAPHT
jgi:predicted  nucleic acid-binding Zn-ribbon protein